MSEREKEDIPMFLHDDSYIDIFKAVLDNDQIVWK